MLNVKSSVIPMWLLVKLALLVAQELIDMEFGYCFKKCVRAEIKRKSTDFFRFVKEKQQIQKNRRLMDFTKEQLSEVLCKYAERENGL